MYLQSFTIKGIKCFGEGTFDFPKRKDGRYAGWHVLLGANATGKTTALQAMAISLVGPGAWTQLLTPVGWARQGSEDGYGDLHATIMKGPHDVADRAQKGPFRTRVYVTPDESIELLDNIYESPQFVLSSHSKSQTLKSVYSLKRRGWFACGYGPFRRLSGGNNESNLTQARQLRVASLFRESVALMQCEPWLRQLHHQAHDDDNPDRARDGRTFDAVQSILNSLLPGAVRLDRVTSAGVEFSVGGGRKVSLTELSDGYRSFLALTVDILRHLAESDPDELAKRIADTSFEGRVWKQVTAEGVVLIDEVDAHLHPSWQRSIGTMLQRVFPNVQFIVSSHSPFIAQAASEKGIFVLRSTEDAQGVTITRPIDSVRGWRADAILTSDLFGLDDTVDLATGELVAEYRQLSTKRSFGKLTKGQQQRLDTLEANLSRHLTAPGESMDEFRRRVDTEAYIQDAIKALEKAG